MSQRRGVPTWCWTVALGAVVLLAGVRPAEAQVPAAERAALIDLYNGTNGAGWTNRTGWLGAAGTECSWYRVTCSGGHVSQLTLEADNLVGTIPSSLRDLTDLTVLRLYSNQLSGIPVELGSLTNLVELNLNGSQMSGNIPASLGSLTNLVRLDLGANHLDGNIPIELANLTNLVELNLSGNQLNGTIPASLGNLTNLQNLALAMNQLSGSIPTSLGSLTNLQNLTLGMNQLSGSIPTSLGNLTNLQSLSLDVNQLSGSIPVEFGSLTSLRYLHLESNQLSGSIPTSLGNLLSLLDLSLSSNQLSGSIPVELGNLTNLWILWLSSNQLSGSIPVELGSLPNLANLYLDGNQLTGAIPTSLGNLTNLEYLDLSLNQLSGPIPASLGGLAQLRQLVLFSNQLSGAIPASLGNLASLGYLALQSNKLTGSLPSTLANLTNLMNGSSDFRWNGLYTSSAALRTFLNSKQTGGNWESTQTIAPTNLAVAGVGADFVNITLTPIVYTGNTGGYRVYAATVSGGPYVLAGQTANKNATSITATGLAPGTTYYFVVETVTDPHANNQNTVVSDRTPEISATTLDAADLSVTQADSPDPVAASGSLAYAVTVANAGPSPAASVVLTDTLPAGVSGISATGPCSVAGLTVTCTWASIAALASQSVTITVTAPASTDDIVNHAHVTSATTDPNAANNDVDEHTIVYAIVAGNELQFLTATSREGVNVIEWLNPTAVPYQTTVVRVKEAATFADCDLTGGFPADPTDGSAVTTQAGGGLGQHDRFEHTGLLSTRTYCYSAFVYKGAGVYSLAKHVKARPIPTGSPIAWGYSTGATTLTPNGLGSWLYAASNDNVLHGMQRGTSGGEWPTNWTPFLMSGPALHRPSALSYTISSATSVVYLASTDGHVYAVDAATGASLWTSAVDYGMLLAGPMAWQTRYGATDDLLLFGTYNSGADNRFVALDPLTGLEVPGWGASQVPATIGIAVGSATVDYTHNWAYFTTEARSSGAAAVWCVRLSDGSVEWSQVLGTGENASTAPSLRGNVLYVGTTAGSVYALDVTNGGAPSWSWAGSDGAVKSLVFPDKPLPQIFFSTENTVWGLIDQGTSYSVLWSDATMPHPTVPLLLVGERYIYLGSDNGNLYEVDLHSLPGTPPTPRALTLGDGTAAVGSAMRDGANALVHVGTEAGVVYAVRIPLP